MAISMYLQRSNKKGEMLEIMDDEEFTEAQERDDGFKELCDILLDHQVVPSKSGDTDKISRKRMFSIELDRALLWKNMYK